MTNPFGSKVDPEVVRVLMDRKTVVNIYAAMGINRAARALHIGSETFKIALVHHGITIRKRGTRNITGDIDIVDEVKTAQMLELERYYNDPDLGCPPNCPGADFCFTKGCTLGEYVGKGEG